MPKGDKGHLKLQNLQGKKFGSWTVLHRTNNKVSPNGQQRSHWLCKCACGTTKSVYANSLTAGKSKSCREKKCTENILTKPYGIASRNTMYAGYRYKCKTGNIKFDMTVEDFARLSQNNCYYCGKEPSNISCNAANNGEYIYNGVDRVDNNKGYILTNLVTACKDCNLAKRILKQDDFFMLVKRIYERHNLNEK